MELTARYLQRYGIRPSFQRISIMKYLMEHTTHPTVDTIFRDLHPSMPTLSRTTVYNTLELFRSRGAVNELTIDGKNARYDAITGRHAHFMCSRCGKIEDVPVPEALCDQIAKLPRHKVERADISFIGLCDECAASQET